jgi:L-fuconolactonase
LKKIDTHLHFWDLDNKINNWVITQTDNLDLKKNFLPNQLFTDSSILGIVHIEAHDSHAPTTWEIQWLTPLMEKHQNIKYAHIAYVDITSPSTEFTKIINQLKQYTCVKGIRHILSHHPKYKYSPCDEDMSEHKNIQANLNCLKQNNLIFDCQMYPYQLHKFLPFIIKSGVSCVVDHFGLPAWDNKKDHELWQQLIVGLGKIDHVYIKLSGLDMFKPETEFGEVLDFCLQNIPDTRLMYGSNYPVSYTNEPNYWCNYLNTFIKNDILKEKIFLSNALALFF